MTLTDPNGGGVYGHAATSTITLCPGATYAEPGHGGQRRRRAESLDQYRGDLCAGRRRRPTDRPAYGTAGQSIMHGPGQFNTDFSLGKTFRVGGLREDAILAFRMEFYNALNHPQFANPGTSSQYRHFRRDHAELRGPPADPVRPEVSLLGVHNVPTCARWDVSGPACETDR